MDKDTTQVKIYEHFLSFFLPEGILDFSSWCGRRPSLSTAGKARRTSCIPGRCRRINEACLLFGTRNTRLVPIHVNAAGNGKVWMNARGWCAYTFSGRTLADPFADCLYAAAEQLLPGQKNRKDYSDGDPDLESPFYILKNTLCPAVLTENLFMDNQEDCKFLLSAAGKRAIVGLHIRAILSI